MRSRVPRRAVLGLAFNATFLALACGDPDLDDMSRATVDPRDAGATGVTVTPVPPTATPVPATPTAVPPALQLLPAQIAQGGFAMVVLNEAASSATVSFQGRQYPMLRSGDRSWAMVGIGAFTQPQLLPVTVSYMPPGRAQTSATTSLSVVDKVYPYENINLDPSTSALLAPDIVNAELARRAAIYSGYTAQKLWSGPFARPNPGLISSIYGEERSYNGGPVSSYHTGTDFAGDTGSPITAAAAGKVAFAGDLRVRGGSVILDHGAGVFSAYHHLSRIDVADGAAIAMGQQLGLMGATGLVTASHLHWEVVVRGVEVDGQLWLAGQAFGL